MHKIKKEILNIDNSMGSPKGLPFFIKNVNKKSEKINASIMIQSITNNPSGNQEEIKMLSLIGIAIAISTIIVVMLEIVSISFAAKFLFASFICYLIYDNFIIFKNKREKAKIQEKIKANLTKAEYEEYLEFGPRG